MFRSYLARLFFRLALLIFFSWVYINQQAWIDNLFSLRLWSQLSWAHLLWLVLVIDMFLHLLPKAPITLGGTKQFATTYRAADNPPGQNQLRSAIRRQNRRAGRIMLIWLLAHAVIAAIYLAGLIGSAELFMLFLFYFVADLICVLVFCPFQVWGMKNRCCIDCRIFNWGHFFMYTPLLLVPSFFSWSLFLLAGIILARWEFAFKRHPERFFINSNAALNCKNCREQICQIKKPFTQKICPKPKR